MENKTELKVKELIKPRLVENNLQDAKTVEALCSEKTGGCIYDTSIEGENDDLLF